MISPAIFARIAALGLAVALPACSLMAPQPAPPAPTPPKSAVAPVMQPPKIALVLGGGAARGFSHVGVIKALEAQGIVPDLVVGTSAGSFVGALYASGYSGFDLQRVALQLDNSIVADWSLPDRGFIRGEALENFVNRAVQNRPLEKLNRPLGVVATDLKTGESVVFRTGNTGMAVRASSSVPGIFQPMTINGREYVDGGLTSPVPVRAARQMGADLVIAVDISWKPASGRTRDSIEMLLQTYAIMGQSIAGFELADADVVIRPDNSGMRGTDFDGRHLLILEGERAAQAAIGAIRQKIAEKTVRVGIRE
jgi:NTE family protein